MIYFIIRAKEKQRYQLTCQLDELSMGLLTVQ